MLYLLFFKSGKFFNCRLLQIIGGAFRVNYFACRDTEHALCQMLFYNFFSYNLVENYFMKTFSMSKMSEMYEQKFDLFDLILYGLSTIFQL